MAGPKAATAAAGSVPIRMPGLAVAAARPTRSRLVVTSQPRASTFATWSAEVTAARQRRMSTPASRTYGLLSLGVLTGGAPDAGSALVNWKVPRGLRDITMPFSSASRPRKSQSVTLAWVMNS